MLAVTTKWRVDWPLAMASNLYWRTFCAWSNPTYRRSSGAPEGAGSRIARTAVTREQARSQSNLTRPPRASVSNPPTTADAEKSTRDPSSARMAPLRVAGTN